MKPVIELKNLSIGYKEIILKDISLSVVQGEVIGIFGRNGCGKTTLLNALIGMPVIRNGQVLLDGNDLTGMKPGKRAGYISLLAQKTPELRGMTVREIIELGAYSAGYNAALKENERRTLLNRSNDLGGRTADIASVLGISELLDKDFAKISEGQRQLTMIGKLLMQDADIMLLDEPDSSLDYINSAMLFELISEKRKNGKTVLMVVHNPETAIKNCDRIWFVEKGSVMEMSGEDLNERIEEQGLKWSI